MMYLAKCTTIVNWVKAHYDTPHNHIKRDAKDCWLECNTQEEAEHVEAMNESASRLQTLARDWEKEYALPY